MASWVTPCKYHHSFLAELLLRWFRVFPPGPQRSHFLALATPEKIAEMKNQDPTVFEAADYGHPDSTIMSYATSSAWTWMVWDKTIPNILLYNDI
jgi:hypothetical protein